MAERIFRIGWVITVILAITLGVVPVYAQSGDSVPERLRYFSDTGHTVAGDFLQKYESATNPELIFGFPITEAFQEKPESRIIQYFEHARFELIPDNPAELRVEITPLGKLLYPNTPAKSTSRTLPGCRFIPEARHNVCYDFLEFYDANGGAAQFGYPISDYEEIDGRIVQYFQRARFEYHPDLPTGEKVQLTDLGKIYFTMMGENPVRLLAVPPPLDGDTLTPLVSKIQARAFSQYAVMHQSGNQTIYVTVQDQRLMSVPGAKVTLEITLPSGKIITQEIEPTNKYGISKFTFPLINETPGLAKVKVRAQFNEISTQTSLSFRVWW